MGELDEDFVAEAQVSPCYVEMDETVCQDKRMRWLGLLVIGEELQRRLGEHRTVRFVVSELLDNEEAATLQDQAAPARCCLYLRGFVVVSKCIGARVAMSTEEQTFGVDRLLEDTVEMTY